jgi:preprotein translocase subunit YajC
MSFFISNAYAEGATQAPPTTDGSFFIMMIGLFVLMYFMIIRPQRKRQKEHDQLMGELSKGDEVVLTSGLLGKVTRIEGDYMIINTGNNIELKFQRFAVHAVLPKGTIKEIEKGS